MPRILYGSPVMSCHVMSCHVNLFQSVGGETFSTMSISYNLPEFTLCNRGRSFEDIWTIIYYNIHIYIYICVCVGVCVCLFSSLFGVRKSQVTQVFFSVSGHLRSSPGVWMILNPILQKKYVEKFKKVQLKNQINIKHACIPRRKKWLVVWNIFFVFHRLGIS